MTSNNQLMVETHAQQVARRIADELKRTGKTVEEMTKFFGVSVQAIYKWQRTGQISKQNLLKLAEYTGRQPDYFLTGVEHAREPDPTYQTSVVVNLTNAIQLFEEMVPQAHMKKIPVRVRAQTIQKMCEMTQADGSMRTAEVLQLIKRVKAKYQEGT